MRKELDLIMFFNKFILSSQSGKRLKRDGSTIKLSTLRQYIVVRDELIRFSQATEFPLRICSILKMTSRETKSEYLYWRKFYTKYAHYLYGKGCYDNYVGSHFKIIRTFLSYLARAEAIHTGDIRKELYVRTEEVPIVVFDTEQVSFLVNNKAFHDSLPIHLRRTKDTIIVGCYVGLRYSDLMSLTKQNIYKSGNSVYLQVRSKKTGSYTKIKLPEYIQQIFERNTSTRRILPYLSNNRFNLNMKALCKKAGWVTEVGKSRVRKGKIKRVTKDAKQFRFCDLVSSHTMRRTAITNLLLHGMPETMVRKLSGHSASSKEFYRYVEFAQAAIDKELDRINELLQR